MSGVITLTTDFGTDDPFAGIMKGIILTLHPRAKIIDLTHAIEPHNVMQAARVLQAAYRYFPKKTVHVAVVDPGVGSRRRPIAVQSGAYTFVGPDNGLFTSVLDARSRCFELKQKKYFLPEVSSTFHGRDIFAPAAAWIAKGIPLKSLGPPIQDPQMLALPEPEWNGKQLAGEIIYIDRFGNAASNLSKEILSNHCRNLQELTVRIGKTVIRGLADHYAQCASGKTGALLNSWGVLEIFRREGHAAGDLKLKVGTTIRVIP